jgi:hypothetical protein
VILEYGYVVGSLADCKFVADTLALFSLINSSIEQIFIHGLLSLTEQETVDLAAVGQKLEELGLAKISTEINTFLENTGEKGGVQDLMRLFTLNRLLERLYTRAFLLGQLQEVS